MSAFSEDTYEQALIELFKELGFRYQYGPDIKRDYTNPILDDVLEDAMNIVLKQCEQWTENQDVA